MTIDNLDPKCVWKNFYALTQIPRPSKKEWRAVDFMENFGKSLGLETIRDEVGNIIIRKPATPGMENRKGVILQGHLDMVPQNNNDVQHDWEKDPETGRMNMIHTGEKEIIKADLVLLAMGFVHPVYEGLVQKLGVDLDGRKNVAIGDCNETSVNKVFAAGDAASGASLVVRAMASGRRAAAHIDAFLRKQETPFSK